MAAADAGSEAAVAGPAFDWQTWEPAVGLWTYIARRLVLAFFVLIVVSVATFLLTHAVPGDPISAILSDRQANNPEVRAALERRWGLNEPLPIQYVYYVGNLLQGDWGESISKRTPVAQELRHRVPATIELTTFALAFAIVVGVPLGIVSALNHDRWPDHLARFITLIGTSLPVFWLGLLMIVLFSVLSLAALAMVTVATPCASRSTSTGMGGSLLSGVGDA